MGRSTFNWWRRNPKRKVLPKTSSLIDRINHGDFEVSQYFNEADREMKTLLRLKQIEEEKGERMGLKAETIRQNVFNATDEYQRRYNRLIKDAIEDENRILHELKVSFEKEFSNIPEYLYKEWLDGNETDMTVEDLYYRCREFNNGVDSIGNKVS